MLAADRAVLVVVDYQEKLVPAIHDREALIDHAGRLIRGAQALDVPIVWTEQNPDGLGPTVPQLAALLPGEAITKFSFGCCGERAFLDALYRLGRKQVLLAGIESHVCVWQTAAGLLDLGCEVQLVADAISSRTPRNRDIGLQKARDAGALLTSVETALFEMLGVAEGPAFKAILKIVK